MPEIITEKKKSGFDNLAKIPCKHNFYFTLQNFTLYSVFGMGKLGHYLPPYKINFLLSIYKKIVY